MHYAILKLQKKYHSWLKNIKFRNSFKKFGVRSNRTQSSLKKIKGTNFFGKPIIFIYFENGTKFYGKFGHPISNPIPNTTKTEYPNFTKKNYRNTIEK